MSEYAIYFDDVNVNELGIRMLKGHEHDVLQGTRDRAVNIPGISGAYDYGADLAPIPFNLPFSVREESPIKMQQVLKGIKSILLNERGKPKTFKLKFGYEADRYYNVRYNNDIPLERVVGGMGRFAIPLICYEGFANSVAKNDEVTWGSLVIPFAADFTMGHTGSGAVEVKGDTSTIVTLTGAELSPKIYISGSGTNVKIGWGGKSFALGTFTSSNWVIDLGAFEVSRNGVNAMHIIKGDWLDMELQQGENNITINGSGLNLTFRVEFRDRYF